MVLARYFGLLLVATLFSATTANAANVCYYDLMVGAGNPSQVEPITTAGHTAVNVTLPDAAGLAGCDVLFAQTNGGGAEWNANLVDIEAAIRAGMVLVFHDNIVFDATTKVPGLGAATCSFGLQDDLSTGDKGTSVTHGPAGFVLDTTLDGGNFSSHGFCDTATLPSGAVTPIVQAVASNRAVTSAFRLDSGAVVYSTIPLSHYLANPGLLDPDFGDVYAPNVVQYGVDLIPANICHYNTSSGAGDAGQAASIVAAGHRPIGVATPNAASLAGCDVLYAMNLDNSSYPAGWTTNLVDIDAAVSAGMVLVFHDRFVTDAATNVPGLGAATCTRDFFDDSNIDIVSFETSITNGPGGQLSNADLDGFTSSSHGFCEASTLPGGAQVVLSRTAANEGVTQAYRSGLGAVVYSTIPLDAFDSGGTAMETIYAPNVIQFGVDLLPADVCYNNLASGSGDADQAASIAAAGHTGLSLSALDAVALAPCDVLYVHNPSNFGYDALWTSNLADIGLAVTDGLSLVFHDRWVTDAATNIPGLSAATCVRDTAEDINVVDSTTVVTDGRGGVVTDATLDGLSNSNHGYCTAAALPTGTRVILGRTDPAEVVTQAYREGAGSVVYSTLPLDFFDSGAASGYATNVIEYGVRLVPEPSALIQQLAGVVALLLIAGRRSRRLHR